MSQSFCSVDSHIFKAQFFIPGIELNLPTLFCSSVLEILFVPVSYRLAEEILDFVTIFCLILKMNSNLHED